MDLFWKGQLAQCPLSHLVMLAPANHGSALAQLGKSRLSRIKSLFQGVDPGQRVLDWLELGSAGSWALNRSCLDYDGVADGVFPFVLTGQSIDRKLYDALNSYTGEAGSDGVVRVASANLNYGLLRLVQEGGKLQVQRFQRAARTALGVLPPSIRARRWASSAACNLAGAATSDCPVGIALPTGAQRHRISTTLGKSCDPDGLDSAGGTRRTSAHADRHPHLHEPAPHHDVYPSPGRSRRESTTTTSTSPPDLVTTKTSCRPGSSGTASAINTIGAS